MSEEYAVVVKDLYKSFRLPHEQISGLKQSMINVFKRTSKRTRGYETQHVLNDVSFEIKKGEFFGIVGKNGSGKSTLLKLLAGIYAPDKGLVQVNGSLTPFIELGVGFNPELTGRENVYLNGALLGFSRDEMNEMYDDIVSFAEIEKFMDQKLKNYSSGMQVRLAFSIAIRAESEILLFDEVLAVGDAAFQQKCYEMFADIKKKGTTVILVTHDMSAVQRFCDRAILIDKGDIKLNGDPMDIADKYLEDNFEKNNSKNDDNPNDTQFDIIDTSLNTDKRSMDIGSPVKLDFTVRTFTKISYQVGFQIFRTDGAYVYGTNTQNAESGPFTGSNDFSVDFDQILAPGTYTVTIAIMDENASSVRKYVPKVVQFTIKQQTKRQGIVLINENWTVKAL